MLAHFIVCCTAAILRFLYHPCIFSFWVSIYFHFVPCWCMQHIGFACDAASWLLLQFNISRRMVYCGQCYFMVHVENGYFLVCDESPCAIQFGVSVAQCYYFNVYRMCTDLPSWYLRWMHTLTASVTISTGRRGSPCASL